MYYKSKCERQNNKEKCLHELWIREKHLKLDLKSTSNKKSMNQNKLKLDISVHQKTLTEWKGKQKKKNWIRVNTFYPEIFRGRMMVSEIY